MRYHFESSCTTELKDWQMEKQDYFNFELFFFSLKNREFPLWHSELRIWCCHSCGMGCSWDSIPSICCGCAAKKETKNLSGDSKAMITTAWICYWRRISGRHTACQVLLVRLCTICPSSSIPKYISVVKSPESEARLPGFECRLQHLQRDLGQN